MRQPHGDRVTRDSGHPSFGASLGIHRDANCGGPGRPDVPADIVLRDELKGVPDRSNVNGSRIAFSMLDLHAHDGR